MDTFLLFLKRIRILKKCKLYTDVTFKNEPIRTMQPNEELNIIDIDYTKTLLQD